MIEPNSESLTNLSRRSFFKIIGIGASGVGGSLLLTTIQSCSKQSSASPTAPLTGQTETLTLANESSLQNVGGFIRRSFGSNANGGSEVIVMRLTASGTSAFGTASVVCPHQHNPVNNPSGTTIVCPFHGSVFGAQANNFGSKISGPTPSGLQTFATTFDGTTITITF